MLEKVNKILSQINLRLEKISHNPKFMDLLLPIIQKKKINLVYDVGANIGQFANELRKNGYKNNIISFEPVSKVHNKLIENSKNDTNWEVFDRCAIGNRDGDIEINISNYDLSSSILQMTPKHLEAKKNSEFINREKTKIMRLDTILKNRNIANEKSMLKIDTQGYEWEVLQGVKENLKKFDVLLVEVSFVKLYEDEKLWNEILKFIESYDFELWLLERGFVDPKTKQILQADVVFCKK